jgi:carbon monoxide dehydrogenase subunit G
MLDKLAGETHFDRRPEEIWPQLTSPKFLCECFPGIDSVLSADDMSATFRVRPKFGFLRTTLDIAVRFVEKVPPTRARAVLRIQGIGSSADAEVEFELAACGDGTLLRWTIIVRELRGLLKTVSAGLTQAAAQQVANETIASIGQRLPPPKT